MKTDSTFWSHMEIEADEFNRRAKRNLRQFEQKKFNSLYRSRNRPSNDQIYQDSRIEIPKNLNKSMKLVRELTKQEQNKQKFLQNKRNYLSVSRNRCLSQTQRVEQNLKRVLSVRESKKNEKSFIQTAISQTQKEQLTKKKILIESERAQKSKITQSRRQNFNSKSLSAIQIRNQTQRNMEEIQKKKDIDMCKNRQKAKSIQQFECNSANKIRKLRESKISCGKFQYQQRINREFKNYTARKKSNVEILSKFVKEAKKINEQKVETEKKLLKFQESLGLRRQKFQRKEPTTKLNQDFFRLTSY